MFNDQSLNSYWKSLTLQDFIKFLNTPTSAIPPLVLVHYNTRLCLCHLPCYFYYLTLGLSTDSDYLGLTLSFSEDLICWSFC